MKLIVKKKGDIDSQTEIKGIGRQYTCFAEAVLYREKGNYIGQNSDLHNEEHERKKKLRVK